MTAYYIMLSGLSLCGVCLCVKNRSRLKDGVFLLISFVVLTMMSAVRYDVGYDYSMIYSPIFEKIVADPTGGYLAAHRWEPGFKLMISQIFNITPNYHTPFVVISIITISLVMLYFWLYSPNPFISVFLFVALGQYYCSMNFMRQMMAAVIGMYAFPLLKKLNALNIAGYFALALLASSFHLSALILIPFFFINLIPINKYTLPAFAVVTLAIYFNTHRIIELVTRYWYSSYGLNSIHVKVPLPPEFTIAVSAVFIIVLLGSKKLLELDKSNYLYVNYAFFTWFFVFMGTRHSILDRLSMYFQLLAPVGIAVILQELAQSLKKEKKMSLISKTSASLAALLLAIFGGGLAIHQFVLVRDHHGVVPYKIIFNQPFYKDYIDSLRTDRTDSDILAEPEDIPFDIPAPSVPERNPDEGTLPGSIPEPAESIPSGEQAQTSQGDPAEVSLEDLFK